jgi:hypothetical protein
MKLSYIESKIFGKVCYGFRRNNDGIVETIPDKAKVVERIFSLYLDGNSLENIQQYLFAIQIPSPSGKEKWSRDVLNKLLNNYKYTFGIVSHEMFEAVESLKESNCRNLNRSTENVDEWNEQQKQNYCGLML